MSRSLRSPAPGWVSRWEAPTHRAAPSPGVGVLAALEGAALIVWNLVATPLIGRRRLRWGTVGTEATDPLPGDQLVPEPTWSYTLGVSIDASPQDVWPWIAQIGQGRGGFYSYEVLENLVGCKITNTTEVLPDHQHPVVGGEIHLHRPRRSCESRSWTHRMPSCCSAHPPTSVTRRAGECQRGSSRSTHVAAGAAGS